MSTDHRQQVVGTLRFNQFAAFPPASIKVFLNYDLQTLVDQLPYIYCIDYQFWSEGFPCHEIKGGYYSDEQPQKHQIGYFNQLMVLINPLQKSSYAKSSLSSLISFKFIQKPRICQDRMYISYQTNLKHIEKL